MEDLKKGLIIQIGLEGEPSDELDIAELLDNAEMAIDKAKNAMITLQNNPNCKVERGYFDWIVERLQTLSDEIVKLDFETLTLPEIETYLAKVRMLLRNMKNMRHDTQLFTLSYIGQTNTALHEARDFLNQAFTVKQPQIITYDRIATILQKDR